MGGAIYVESEEGRGSTFSVSLTLPRGQAPAPRDPPPPAQDVEPMNVLVVDDNVVNRRVAQRMMSLLGCEVTLATDGEDALAHMRSSSFDLVLMDCQMPVMDGYQAAEQFRSWEKEQDRPRTPILALTANARAEDSERARISGMDEHLSKPLTRKKLEDALRRYSPSQFPSRPG